MKHLTENRGISRSSNPMAQFITLLPHSKKVVSLQPFLWILHVSFILYGFSSFTVYRFEAEQEF